MKDIMVVAQIASSTDAARVNVGVADGDADGGSFEAALNEQMMHGEQAPQEAAEVAPPANAEDASGDESAEVDEVTVSDDEPHAEQPLEQAMMLMTPVAPQVVATDARGSVPQATALEQSAAIPDAAVQAPSAGQAAAHLATIVAADAAAPQAATLTNAVAPIVAEQTSPQGPTSALGEKIAAPTVPGGLAPNGNALAIDGSGATVDPRSNASVVAPGQRGIPGSVGPTGNALRYAANVTPGGPASARAAAAEADGGDALRQTFTLDAAEMAPRVAETAPGTGGSSFASALGALAQPRQDASSVALQTRALPPLDSAIDSSEWGSGLGARIVWGLGNGVRAATLEVHPRELGPVNIQLTMGDEEAKIQFTAQHAVVREAIEAALPRLREALANDGIRLGDVAVGGGGDSAAGDADGRSGRSDGESDGPTQAHATAEIEQPRAARTIDSLVDTFA